jgi:hypothetical protein
MMSDMQNKADGNSRVAFERARLDYCAFAFQMQRDTSDMLERRAKFFLSLITILMGSVFLKLDLLKELFNLPDGTRVSASVLIPVALSFLILFGSALLAALVALSISMQLRRSKDPHPARIVDELFAPSSSYLEQQDEPALLRKIALNYAIAWEGNAEINRRKTQWIQVGYACVLCAALSFCVLLLVVCLSYVFT